MEEIEYTNDVSHEVQDKALDILVEREESMKTDVRGAKWTPIMGGNTPADYALYLEATKIMDTSGFRDVELVSFLIRTGFQVGYIVANREWEAKARDEGLKKLTKDVQF